MLSEQVTSLNGRMLMTEFKTKKKSNILKRFFSSVKLTVALLIILAIASVLGTFIPQREGAIEFARRLSPEMFRLFSSLNLFDMYHSLWFRLLIGCLALNLVICSINRFPGTWKRFRARPRADRSKPFEHVPPQQTFLVQGEVKNTAGKVGRFLQGRYKKIQTKEAADGHFFYGEKGRYSHFGVYLVHSSILFILIGALAGSFFGFEASVNIPEGDRVDTVTLRKNMAPLKLGFEVRCDKFTVDFYENGSPKEYRSELTFSINGKEIEKRSLLVNHPVQFRGVSFYQSSYGTLPGRNVHLEICRNSSESEVTKLTVEVGSSLPLPGNEGRFRVADIKEDFMNRLGPAVMISIRPQEGEEVHFWVFEHHEMIQEMLPLPMSQSPKFNPSAFKPYTFLLEGLERGYYTGLQVNKDPGVSIVWLGCFLMVVGFFVTFFTSHKRIWVCITGERREIKVSTAGTASKNPVGLQRELKQLTDGLRNMFKKKG